MEAAGPLRLEALVLAAGSGSRFGGGKLTRSFRGAPLIHGALAAARGAPVHRVNVVVGADAGVAAAVHEFDPSLRIIQAHDHAEGMAASLRAGLNALATDASGVLVFLGDMPCIGSSVTAELARAMEAGASAAAPVFAGRRGHPVAMARRLFPRLLDLRGDQGARAVIDDLGDDLVLVETNEGGVLFDVDTPADLARF